jgi:hypothetical protein
MCKKREYIHPSGKDSTKKEVLFLIKGVYTAFQSNEVYTAFLIKGVYTACYHPTKYLQI